MGLRGRGGVKNVANFIIHPFLFCYQVNLDGTFLPFQTGEIIFGEPGTNGQHRCARVCARVCAV